MDVSSILSESGVSFGALTLASAAKALLTLVVGLVVIRLILQLVDRAFARSERLAPFKRHLRPIVKAALGVVLALVVLDSLGVKVTSFIALLSVAGLAVSLALQNTLSNIAGGMMIVTAQPFGIGDFVSIGGTEGTVDFIRLSHTRLRTPDNKEIQIPNSVVAAATITNFNRLGRRRLDLEFTAPEVHLKEYGASSISYLARMWTPSADYWDVYWGVTEAVRETFASHNVEMTYDHLNVHMGQ